MTDTVYKSSLSSEEINKKFEDVSLFDGIMSGIEDILEYENGNSKTSAYMRKRSLPETDVAKVRNELNLTQKTFAVVLGVSQRTIEAWESGRSTPTPTARNLIYLISEDHSLVAKLLSARSIQ